MSMRCTIRHDHDDGTGQGFHLYEDLSDERDCVMLELEGFTFETSVSFAPPGRPEIRVLIRIQKRTARSLGLIATESKS